MPNLVVNPLQGTFDNCLVAGFLKKLLTKSRVEKKLPELIVYNTIAEIKEVLNQPNISGAIEVSPEYLSAIENSFQDLNFRYAIIYKDHLPVLFAYFQLFNITSRNFKLDTNKRFVRGIFRFFLDFHKARILQLGNTMRTETPGYSFDPRYFNNEDAMEAIASIAEKIAADEKVVAVILKDIPTPTPSIGGILGGMGYQQPWDDQIMQMEVDSSWKSFNDYTAALSRKYKTRAKKAIELRNKFTISALNETQIKELQPDIYRLYSEVTTKQAFVLSQTCSDYFISLKKLYKDNFEVYGYFLEGKLVAFYSAFVTPENYEVYYIGINYEINNEYQLYFNILFSGLERAIQLRKGVLKLGRTSFDAKASLGAKPKSLDYHIKMANIPDFVIKWFVCYFNAVEDGKWKQRNPLKSMEAQAS